MKIIEKQGNIKLEYTLTVKHTPKTDKIRIPPEIIQYLNIQSRTYIYTNKQGQTCITTRQPHVKHHIVHVYKDHTINIPSTVIKDITSMDSVTLTLDLSRVDDYKNGLGLLTITT